jgi:hypothetical protein
LVLVGSPDLCSGTMIESNHALGCPSGFVMSGCPVVRLSGRSAPAT